MSADAPSRTDAITHLQQRIRDFSEARDWQSFHIPRNLAMSIAIEAGELMEHFQWERDGDSGEVDATTRADIAAEAADIFIYLLRFCDVLDIDLADATHRKMDENLQRFPVERVKGRLP